MKKIHIIVIAFLSALLILMTVLYFKKGGEQLNSSSPKVEEVAKEKQVDAVNDKAPVEATTRENSLSKSVENNTNSLGLKQVSKAILSEKDKQLISNAFNSKDFKQSFSDTIKNKNDIIVSQSYMNAVSSFYDTKFGTLQNNIQNLQLPSGAISISNNWGSLLYKNLEYLQSAKDEKEYYVRVHQFINSIYAAPGVAYELSAGMWEYKGDAKDQIVGFTKTMRNREDIKHYILYVMSIDPYSNNSKAKEYFEKNGINETVRTVESFLGDMK